MKTQAEPEILPGFRKNFKMQGVNSKILALASSFCILIFGFGINGALAQDPRQTDELELNVDAASSLIPLPKIFKPNIDLSGRGFFPQENWPQQLAAPEVLEAWGKDIGFRAMYRLQYNLWEIEKLAYAKPKQDELLENYESVIKKISESGGVVILDLFGTPEGLGRTPDVRCAPSNLPALKQLVKQTIRKLSCEKKYNIWYEVWSAPDLDNFFLGRKQDYFYLYKAIAEAAKELEAETKVFIPVGGPSASYWFQNFDGNTILTPERSLIYELIKFCYRHRLPLNFITWHSYSSDPSKEKETTAYKKTPAELIREWLSYFNFSKDIPLIVDEWNYDTGRNVLAERKEESFITASYIPHRIKNFYAQGFDYQIYFSLEDFWNEAEGVVRNVGVFWFDPHAKAYKGEPKIIYNVFKMLSGLGNEFFDKVKFSDEFVRVIATRTKDGFVLLISNYIDPDIAQSYLSRNLSTIRPAETRELLRLVKNGVIEKVMSKETDLSKVRCRPRVRALIKKALEQKDLAERLKNRPRKLTIIFKNLKDDYISQRYAIDSSCSLNCDFAPLLETQILRDANSQAQEILSLNPYSVYMLVLKKKPKEPPPPPPPPQEVSDNQTLANITVRETITNATTNSTTTAINNTRTNVTPNNKTNTTLNSRTNVTTTNTTGVSEAQ
jgi:hypothetical protein